MNYEKINNKINNFFTVFLRMYIMDEYKICQKDYFYIKKYISMYNQRIAKRLYDYILNDNFLVSVFYKFGNIYFMYYHYTTKNNTNRNKFIKMIIDKIINDNNGTILIRNRNYNFETEYSKIDYKEIKKIMDSIYI